MDVLEDMAEITADNAGGTLRYFAGGDPDTRDIEPLFVREDLEWNDAREEEVESELLGVAAKETHEYFMAVENVNQIIKVADTKVLFTGFVEDEVAVAAFDRGVFPHLPEMVAAFREYMIEHDVEFVTLEM
ncbi:MAG: hypothetical protein ABEH35_05930 [Haloarculaceae archaeon]